MRVGGGLRTLLLGMRLLFEVRVSSYYFQVDIVDLQLQLTPIVRLGLRSGSCIGHAQLGPADSGERERRGRRAARKYSRAGELGLELECPPRPTASLTVSATAMLGDWLFEMCFGRVCGAS
jgi:hypothetical protein